MTGERFKIIDSVFDPEVNTKDVYYYKGTDGRIRYKVWIYIEGIHLFYVDYVVYHLHPTFRNPTKKVKRHYSNEKCALAIWTWGVFNVGIKIYLKTGEIVELNHRLTFDEQLQLPDIALHNTKSSS